MNKEIEGKLRDAIEQIRLISVRVCDTSSIHKGNAKVLIEQALALLPPKEDMDIAKTMKEYRLFAAPLNNGEWMVGWASTIYHLNVGLDHYKDERLAIAPTLEEAIQKWTLTH